MILELSIIISNYIRNRNYVETDNPIICDADKLGDKGYHEVSDWIIEIIFPGTQSRDYDIKLFQYQISGVREYWILNPERKMVNVYDFENDEAAAIYFFDS